MHAHQDAACGTCSKCPTQSTTPVSGAAAIRGWRLIGTAGVTFLLPLICAIVGAAVCGETEPRRFGGAFAGLFLGMVAAAVIARCCRPKLETICTQNTDDHS